METTNYYRVIGEEIRARLFPEARKVLTLDGSYQEGPKPIPMPVAIRLEVPGDEDWVIDVKFVPVRCYQWVGDIPEAVDPTRFDVTFMGYYIGEVDLEFGREFELPTTQGELTVHEYIVREDPDPQLDGMLMDLLRGITGTLTE